MKTRDIINKAKLIGLLIGIMIILQVARWILKNLFFMITGITLFTDRMASFVAIVILSILILIISKKRGISLSIFPEKFKLSYIIATIIFFSLLFYSVLISPNITFPSVALLLYSSIATPVYEEIIFRGFMWYKLEGVFRKQWQIYIITTLLFALWHLGYVDSLALRNSDALGKIMFWKVVTGLCFGAILGLLRMKTRNCYSTILLHGIMNLLWK